MSSEEELKSKIRNTYQEELLRKPRNEELQHFFIQIKSGNLTLRGFLQFVQSCQEFKNLANLKKGRVITNEGFELIIDTKDLGVSKILADTNSYEINESRFFKQIIKKGMHVVDIGANIGYFTILFSKLVGSEGKITAFEPSPRSFNLLKKNIKLNSAENIDPIQKAVSNFSGKAKLYLSNHNAGDNRLFANEILKIDKGREVIEVETVRLDDYLKDELISLLKIDVQGGEMNLIDGALKTISNNQNLKMIIEFWPIGLSSQGIAPHIFLEKIKQLGFLIFDMNHLNETKESSIEELIKTYQGQSYTNLFCTKEKFNH